MENQPLATELIKELRAQNKRSFILNVILSAMIIIIVVVFIWYLTLPIDEISIDADGGNANYIGRDLEGELYNGENNEETQTSSQS